MPINPDDRAGPTPGRDVYSVTRVNREVRVLLSYMDGKQGDYVTWLSNLDRQLKLKVGRVT